MSSFDMRLPDWLDGGNYDKIKSGIQKFLESREVEEAFFLPFTTGDSIIYQGDCLNNVPGKEQKFFVVSNSCDFSKDNKRKFYTPCVLGIQLRTIEGYEKFLKNREIPEADICNHLKAVRQNVPTSILFLPDKLKGGYLAFLDRIENIPAECIYDPAVEPFFRLNNWGIYLLSYKIGIHFCRMNPDDTLRN